MWDLVRERTLVLFNHQSTSDVPLIMAAFNSRQNLSDNIMWIMDHVFRLTNFGIVSWAHGDFFIHAVSFDFNTHFLSFSIRSQKISMGYFRIWNIHPAPGNAEISNNQSTVLRLSTLVHSWSHAILKFYCSSLSKLESPS